MYFIEKTINKLFQEGFTFFLNPKELKEIVNHLKKNSFLIFKPYEESEKNIIYLNEQPNIILFEIITSNNLRHQDILGSLFSLGIDEHLFGDIIIDNNHYYFYTFKNLKTYFEMELTKIKNSHIELKEVNTNLLNNYQPNFEKLKVITSSLRIDSVISKVIHTNRNNIKELIKEKKIIYNYDLLKDNTKLLKENDTFSVRKYGKYKFTKILSTTKKDNLIIEILKYQSNDNN